MNGRVWDKAVLLIEKELAEHGEVSLSVVLIICNLEPEVFNFK